MISLRCLLQRRSHLILFLEEGNDRQIRGGGRGTGKGWIERNIRRERWSGKDRSKQLKKGRTESKKKRGRSETKDTTISSDMAPNECAVRRESWTENVDE